MKSFIKNNIKTIILYSIILILIVVALVVNIRKCVLDNKGNGTTTIMSQTFLEMIDRDEDFVLILGQEQCSACKSFNDVLRKYTASGNKAYYLYIDNVNDLYLTSTLNLIKEKINMELPIEKRVKILSTPTTIYVEDGLFKDISIGTFNAKDDDAYNRFHDVVKGNNAKRKIIINENEFIEKINNQETFTLTLGSINCGYCKAFEDTIHRYIADGNTLYYLYLNDLSNDTYNMIINLIDTNIPQDRDVLQDCSGIDCVGTPTTIYIENGVFKDAVTGFIDIDSDYYSVFKDVVNGEYIGETYPFA